MTRLFFVLMASMAILSSCSHSYFIVRHAEKVSSTSMMSSDVPLTDQGKQRAEALKEIMRSKKIAYVFSTKTDRTMSTARPTAEYFHLTIENYGPRPDSAFIALLKSKKKNTLVVGHSNTIDDIVNMLCGETKVPGDLPETEYDHLYEVRVKGKKTSFHATTYSPQMISR